MRKLSKEAKFNLKNGFGSLVSNRCAIEAGKSMPIWLTIIMGLVGPALAMVPIMVNVARTNGSSAAGTDTNNYSIARNFSITMVDYNNSNVELKIDGDHFLTYYKDGTAVTTEGTTNITNHVNSQSNQYDIRTYWLSDSAEKDINAQFTEIINQQYIVGTTTLKSDTDKDKTYYKPISLCFHKKGFMFSVYKSNSTTLATNFSGDFYHTEAVDLVKRLGTVNGKMPTSYEEIIDVNYEKGLLTNLRALLDECYTEIKGRTFLYTSTIYYSVYVGLVIMLGLLMFIITRGKKNFNNYLKWYQCMGISAWACISPGLIALAFGFWLSSYAMMMFILLMGVRTMWLSMKQLSPTYQG